MTKYNNMWATGRPFRDELSHFNKFTKASIQKFFGVSGQWVQVEDAPNWVQPESTDSGVEFRLIRLTPENELELEFPVWINFKRKDGVHAFEKPDPGKGKAVAFWNHRVQAGPLEFWSDDGLKTIICDAEGRVHATPCRMTPLAGKGAAYNQMRMSVDGGELALTPFVILAFFMWLESPEGAEQGSQEVLDYLVKIGWDNAATD